MLIALLDALAHAHARGVVHKDLKPANVLLFGGGESGSALKLTDFGIALAGEQEERSGLVEDAVMGSPHHVVEV